MSKAPPDTSLDMTSFVEVLPPDEKAAEKTLELSVTPRHAVIGTGNSTHQTQICATVTAREPPGEEDEDHRAPVDIVVALDNSLSMGDRKKLALCKKSLELTLRTLTSNDRFGLVSFSDDAIVELPIERLSLDHKNKALAVVKSLETRFSTNVSAAIGLASQELRRDSNPNAVRTIFLLTDGLANNGIQEKSALVQFTQSHCLVNDVQGDDESSSSDWINARRFPMQVEALDITEEAPKETPISLHCFGYGSDHDSRMLQAISDATPGGTYYFVENDSNVLTAFGDALGGVLSVVAQNAVLDISVPEESKELGVSIVRVHHKNVISRQDGSFSISLGDFYAEESRDVVFEVELATPRRSAEHTITHAIVSLSFTDTLLMKPAPCPPKFACEISRIPGKGISSPSQHVKLQLLREAIAEADKFSQSGNIKAARAVIDGMLDAIELSTDDCRSDPLVEQLIVDLHRIQEGLVSVDSYNLYGGHRMHNTLQSHESQRCNDSTGKNNFYRKTNKFRTIGKFVGN